MLRSADSAGEGNAHALFAAVSDAEDHLPDGPRSAEDAGQMDRRSRPIRKRKNITRWSGELGFPGPQAGLMSLGSFATPYEATMEFDPRAETVDVRWEVDGAFDASYVMLLREGDAVRWGYADHTASADEGYFQFTEVELGIGEYQAMVWSFSDGITSAGRLYSGVLVVPAETEPQDFSTLQYAQYLEANKPQAAAAIKALPWVADGVDRDERGCRRGADRRRQVVPGCPWDDLLQRSWVRDGVTVDEAAAIHGFRWMGRYNSAVGEGTRQQPWG